MFELLALAGLALLVVEIGGGLLGIVEWAALLSDMVICVKLLVRLAAAPVGSRASRRMKAA